ncbi:DNA/RNA non-specific endonuclease [Streptomyces sp. NPDC056723]|uniref:DNA/RNA non-specific endonuclease n=1 Tax=Streptomyces sp. NPDC056723 TaxID=3345925 RepID=UPI0036B9787D
MVPGFVHGTDHNQGRGHMLAQALGGSGGTLDNLFTITQNPKNSPHMRDLELQIRDAARTTAVPLSEQGVLLAWRRWAQRMNVENAGRPGWEPLPRRFEQIRQAWRRP